MAAETNENFSVTDISMEWKARISHPYRDDSFGVKSPVITYLNADWEIGLHKVNGFYEMCIGGDFHASPQHCVYYTIGMKKADGSVYKSANGSKDMIRNSEPDRIQRFIRHDILMRDKMDVAPDDTVVIFCYLSLNRNSSQNSIENDVMQTENADRDCKLKEDLESLFLNGTHFDTIIKVCGTEFKVHRAILGARSCVFQSMFSHDTTERNTGIVEITDSDPDVFQHLLHFLYCGEVEEELASINAVQVFELADKYCVDEMKIAYVDVMKRTLCVNSFCDVVGVALKYKELELLKSATNFFLGNTKGILMTDEWQCFLKLHTAEANELLIKAIDYRDNDNCCKV